MKPIGTRRMRRSRPRYIICARYEIALKCQCIGRRDLIFCSPGAARVNCLDTGPMRSGVKLLVAKETGEAGEFGAILDAHIS